MSLTSFNASPTIEDLHNYCLGACNGANRRCQVRCQAGRAHAKDWARPQRAYKLRPPEVDDFEQPPKRCCSSDFHTKHIVGKSLFRTKWNSFGFVNETRNGEMAGVQSWLKCWLSGSCPRAQCQRWWTMNICHSVVSCLLFKTKVSLKRRCFQQCLELENLIKYDAGWYIFFVAMLNWIAASPVNCTGGQLTPV